MKKMLLLSCGTNACIHIAKVLKNRFPNDFFIIGCDINKEWLVGCSQWLDDFVQTPFSTDSKYYEFVLKVCKAKNIDWIIPVYDSDQFLFTQDNKDLQELDVKSFGLPLVLDFYKDKQQASDFLSFCGIPVPKYYSIDELDEETTYFIKPVKGSGSIGVRKASGRQIKNIENIQNYIIQEICIEPEYTLECFNFNGKIYSVCRERIASKSGVCTKTRIFYNSELEKNAVKLLKRTQLPYVFNMQFMKDYSGEYVCTDLNLRTAGGMALSDAAGWDEVSALANIMLGKDESTIAQTVNKKICEQYVVRHYEEVVTKKVNNRIAFDLDGTLLDSRKRHEIVMTDVLKKHKIALDTSTLVAFKSDGKNNIDWLVANGLTLDKAREINAEWISLIEKDEYLKNDVLYSDVLEVLQKLSKENDLYLVTARNNKAGCLNQIKSCGVEQYFTEIEIVDSCKETSELKAGVLQKYQIDYFIGDTESDYKATEIADCDFKAVSYGFRNRDYWDKKNIMPVNDLNKSNFLE